MAALTSRPEDRKSDVLRATGGLAGSGGGATAFELCPDYAKLNSARHQSARADTFKTPPALTRPTTAASTRPNTPCGVQARRDQTKPTVTHEALEIFEMGVARHLANFRNEVRDELQEAREVMRKELLEVVVDTRGHSLLGQIDKKVDEIKAGPVNIDLSKVLEDVAKSSTGIMDSQTSATQLLMHQVERAAHKLEEEMHMLFKRQQKVEQEHADLHAASLEALGRRLEAQVSGVGSAAQRAIREAMARTAEGVKELSEQGRGYHQEAKQAVQATTQRDQELLVAVRKLEPEFVRISGNQEALCASCDALVASVEEARREARSFNAGLTPCLEAEFARHFEAHSRTVNLLPVMQELADTQQTINFRFPQLLGEIGKVQKAVNTDFIHPDDLRLSTANALSNAPAALKRRADLTNCNLQIIPGGVDKPPVKPSVLVQRSRGRVLPLADGYQQEASLPCSPILPCSDGGGSVVGGGYSKDACDGATLAVRRVRQYWAQTDRLEYATTWTQTIEEVDDDKDKAKKKKKGRNTVLPAQQLPVPGAPVMKRASPFKAVFADSEAMKKRARQALLKPEFQVESYYHTTGIAQKIARSAAFEIATMAAIFLNAIWIAIDADHNDAPFLIEAHPVFQVAENAFCLYFFVELLIRFCAFKVKRDCLRDKWFIFDAVLVFFMVCETWVLSIIILEAKEVGVGINLGNISMLRMVRMVKLMRISRMARLLRGLPELFILLKGMKAASRSVAVFMVLWLIIVYVYALFIRMISGDRVEWFKTVPVAIQSLVQEGLLPKHSRLFREATAEVWALWPVLFSFIVLASVLLMNMLVGVLVEVVNAISSTEKDGIQMMALATDLREVLTGMGFNIHEHVFNDKDIERLVAEGEFARVVSQAGTDVVAFAEMAHTIFEDRANKEVRFADLLDLIHNMRGSNPAQVKDIKSSVRAIKAAVKESEHAMYTNLLEEINELRVDLHQVKMMQHDLKITALLDEDEAQDEESNKQSNG